MQKYSRGAQQPKLLDRPRRELAVLHRSPRTVQAHVGWVRRYVRFHGTRHPAELGLVRRCPRFCLISRSSNA